MYDTRPISTVWSDSLEVVMRLRRNRPQPKSRIGPDTEVYVLDVTERWYNDQHSYWAFTDPAWYAWATTSETAPPPWLARTNDRIGAELPPNPSHNDRILYLYHGAVMLHGGHFIGSEKLEIDEWLAGRQPLGLLEAVEDTSPFEDD